MGRASRCRAGSAGVVVSATFGTFTLIGGAVAAVVYAAAQAFATESPETDKRD